MKPTTTDKGRAAEDKALTYLVKHGLTPVTRNYRSTRGEIDLIMQDGDITVFVEVRARSKNNILHAIETIDQRKKNRIILTSQHYLQHAEKFKSRYYRYDVIALSGSMDRENIEWIKNAFDA